MQREYLEEDVNELGLIEPQLSQLKRIIVRETKGSAMKYKLLKFLIENGLSLAQVELYSSKTNTPIEARQVMREFAERLGAVTRASQMNLTFMFFEAN